MAFLLFGDSYRISRQATFETICANCGLLHSANASERLSSYRWLRHCKPFMSVVRAYSKQRFTISEVAWSLAPGTHTMQTSVMTALLRLQLAAEGDSH